MKYTRFIIENYKGISFLDLDLSHQPDSKIITLVGLNESGKTSILQAINLLSKTVSKEESHKLIPKKDKVKFTGAVSVQGYIDVDAYDNGLIKNRILQLGFDSIKPIQRIKIQRTVSFENSKFVRVFTYWTIDLTVRRSGQTTYEQLDDKSSDWHSIIELLQSEFIPKILYYPDFLFDFPNRIYLDRDVAAAEKQDQFRDVIQDILSSIDSDLTIEDHLIARIKDKSEASQESLDHVLSKMSAQVSKVVLGAWKNIMNIQGKEFLVTAKYTGASGEERHYLEFQLKEETEKYFIAERSLGFKWFFTFLLFTEFRKNRKTDIGETLFLLDEPASNLHSTAQKKLLAKFAELTSRSRLIYTTHSHHLIDPDWLNGTYVVKNSAISYKDDVDFDTNESDISAIAYRKFASSSPSQQDYFQPILDALEYQPGLLEKIPEIVITEGKFDYYTLKYMHEVVHGRKALSLRLYPGNGADANDQVIRLYLAWGRKFKVLLDGDVAGSKARKRYVNNFGDEIKNYLITYEDIDPSINCATEDVFSNAEKLAITQRFDAKAKTYDKSKFNTALQTLYITKEIFPFSQETILRFSNILKYLERK